MKWRIEDTPERAAFRSEFIEWLSTVLPDGWVEAVENGDDEALGAIKKGWNWMGWTSVIGASGFGAPLWPREYGGLSGESWMQQITREELQRFRLPLFSINILGVGLAGPTIVEHGTDAQRARYLKKILTAEEVWCQLFSEPGSGSDLASVSTRAERDGDEWVVNGQKVWTSIGQFAQFGMLLARTDPSKPKHEGLSYFIVDMKSPGVEVRPLRQMTGSAEFNEVFFDNVRIPDENRVGEIGQGWRVARTTLMNERVTLSGLSIDPASMMGGVKKDPWSEWVGSFRDTSDPVIRQKIAQYYSVQELKEVTAFRALSARLRGDQPGPEGSVNKVMNAEFQQRRTSFAVNAAGPNGVAWVSGDQDAERRATAFLRARANTIEGGTSEVLRNQIAERILGLPRDVAVDKDVAWQEVVRN